MATKSRIAAAFQGELGAFSHQAAQKLLGRRVLAVPCASFREVFESLDKGKVSHAIIPIENTLHGSVHENYDHLVECDFAIRGETSVRISHQLITMPGVRFSELRQAFSHPVALNQCRRFFEKNRRIEPVPFYDTAGSVKMLRERRPPAAAAIASETAAHIYGGVIQRRNIEDDTRNFTRFFLLSKHYRRTTKQEREWKTSLVFAMPNVPGALFKAMACFALRNINLTKIESRPLRGKPWEYLFYVDLHGSTEDKQVKNALSNLAELTNFLKVLGSYRPTP
ncbi:MAG: prephenate dehydratase [Acidobacteriaceae bacterium]|nr:prephenate dehydratase [Acidobacteriaceae bacterium]